MGAMASRITSLTIVYSTVHLSGADQWNIKAPCHWSLYREFTRDRWINRWLVNSPHNRPVTRKMFPFDDVIMNTFRLRQNGRQFVNIFKCIFVIEKVVFLLKFHWILFLMSQLIIRQCEKIFNLHDILTPASKSKHCSDILTPPPPPTHTHPPTPTPHPHPPPH